MPAFERLFRRFLPGTVQKSGNPPSQNRTARRNPHSIHLYIGDHSEPLVLAASLYCEGLPMGVDTGVFRVLPREDCTPERLGAELLALRQEGAAMPFVTQAERERAVPSYRAASGGKGFLWWLRRYSCIELRFGETALVEYLHRETSGENRGYSPHQPEQSETIVSLPPDTPAKALGETVYMVYAAKHSTSLCPS